MEPVIYFIYTKFTTILTEYQWDIFDLSILSILLPWKDEIYPFLMEKLIINIISPKLEQLLSNFDITPNSQDLKPFWILSQWYENFFSNNFQLIKHFLFLLEKYFFPKWLNVLFYWLSNYKGIDNYKECIDWYLGWKQLFIDYNFDYLYQEYLYLHFQNALQLIYLFINSNKNS